MNALQQLALQRLSEGARIIGRQYDYAGMPEYIVELETGTKQRLTAGGRIVNYAYAR